jgi:peptide/nickel transport system substrate-binding protein
LAQEWTVEKKRGTIKVVDLFLSSASVMFNHTEGLVTVDKESHLVPCLARDWRWINDRTIEFKLRRGVTFHNGEEFNAEAVRVNWEAYKSMGSPRAVSFHNLPDEAILEIVDKHMVRFTLSKPDALAMMKFRWFVQAAPAFYRKHKVEENKWGYYPEAGPWGTGPFELVEGISKFGEGSEKVVLEAYEDYWDPQYPKLQKVIFDNSLIGDRDEAMKLCREEVGAVDIVNHIRPLDTIKVAESPQAKVVKSKDPNFLCGFFNQRKRNSKWKDIRLRKAVNYALNRDELLKYAAKGNAYNIGGFIPPESSGYNPNLTLYTYDIGKARSLLAEAGYPDGFEMRLVAWEAWGLEGQIISKMLERIGLKVKVEIINYFESLRKTYIPLLDKPIEEQDWDLVIGGWGDVYAQINASFLALVLIDDSNWRWIEYDCLYEKMWKEMAREVSAEMQAEKMQEMEQYVYNNAYFLFIYSPLSLYAVNKEVNFVPQKDGWLRFKEASVTDKHWSVR